MMEFHRIFFISVHLGKKRQSQNLLSLSCLFCPRSRHCPVWHLYVLFPFNAGNQKPQQSAWRTFCKHSPSLVYWCTAASRISVMKYLGCSRLRCIFVCLSRLSHAFLWYLGGRFASGPLSLAERLFFSCCRSTLLFDIFLLRTFSLMLCDSRRILLRRRLVLLVFQSGSALVHPHLKDHLHCLSRSKKSHGIYVTERSTFVFRYYAQHSETRVHFCYYHWG